MIIQVSTSSVQQRSKISWQSELMMTLTTENFSPSSRRRSFKLYIIIDSKQAYVARFCPDCLKLQNCICHTQQMFQTNSEHSGPTAVHFKALIFSFTRLTFSCFSPTFIFVLIDEAFVINLIREFLHLLVKFLVMIYLTMLPVATNISLWYVRCE